MSQSRRAITGVIAPCITPFRADGEVDETALGTYLDFLATRVHAVSVGAIYGSGILMRPEQRQRVAAIAAEIVRGRSSLLVFVGAPDTDTAVLLARHAQKIGADAVTCVAPFYYRQVDEALYRHFQALVDAVDLPVYAYDSPVFAVNALSFDVEAHLREAGLTGIITGAAGHGIEHLWEHIRRASGSSFAVVSMRDGLALPAMMMGSPAFESGVANFWPELAVELYDAIAEQRYPAAAELQQRVLMIRDISHALGKNIPTLHALIRMRGLATGVPKRPFFLLAPEEIDRLKTSLGTLNFTTPLA